ncbi:MAG: rhomboid family intramembrane serine protease [Candidatus Acidiferrales bacterium]
MPVQKCPACGKQFEKPFGDPTLSLTCPECTNGLAAAESPNAFDEALERIVPARPIATWVLIGINALVFIVMVVRGASWWEPTVDQALNFGANFGPSTLQGQWWRLFTCMFVHFGIIHIALNMWCLWDLGRMAERTMGRAGFLIAYFASGLFASIASLLWDPMRVSAGASGAIFGVAGALVSFLYFKKAPVDFFAVKKKMGSLGAFIFYNLVHRATHRGIDNSAHLGGLAMGLAVGAILPRAIVAMPPEFDTAAAPAAETALTPGAPRMPTPEEISAFSSKRRLLLAGAAVTAGLLVICGALLAKRLGVSAIELGAVQQMLDAGQTDKAIAQLQQIVARDPSLATAQYMLGAAYLQEGFYALALGPLNMAVTIDPENVAYQHNLGAAYLGNEDYGQAATIFEKVVPNEPNDARAHAGLGTAYLASGRSAQAIPELQKAASLDPDLVMAQDNLGRAYFLAGRYAESRATYQQVLQKHPGDAAARSGLALAASKGAPGF